MVRRLSVTVLASAKELFYKLMWNGVCMGQYLIPSRLIKEFALTSAFESVSDTDIDDSTDTSYAIHTSYPIISPLPTLN